MGNVKELNVPADYATVQEAHDAATPGNTIKLAPGTYDCPMLTKSNITIEGSRAGDTTIRSEYCGKWFRIYCFR